MSRAEEERVRARSKLRTLRAILDSISIAIEDPACPPGHDGGQAVTSAAVDLAVTLGKLDAYMRTDAVEMPVRVCGGCPFLRLDGETGEADCGLASRSLSGMGWLRPEERPDWCPLETKGPHVVRLEKKR